MTSATGDSLSISLIAIDRDGTPRDYLGVIPEAAVEPLRGTAALYELVGFEEPWIGYLVLAQDRLVGSCGFKSAPSGGRVEIAYFTFSEFENRGLATAAAARLVCIAQQQDASIVVAAQTLPARNASHRILEKLGFEHVDTLDHPDDGIVREWHLEPDASGAGK